MITIHKQTSSILFPRFLRLGILRKNNLLMTTHSVSVGYFWSILEDNELLSIAKFPSRRIDENCLICTFNRY